MLRTIHVMNLGVIGEVEADLPPGLVCLTGETGAGKSLIVDAISLLLGARADPGLVRVGAREAVVEAVFTVPAGEHPVFEAAGYGVEDGEVRLRRVVSADGRSRAYIQGRIATARELRELGGRLVSVAGQHAFIGLSSSADRVAMLDAFAGTISDRAAMRKAWREFEAARERLEDLQRREAERARRQDYLEFVVGQIQAVSPLAGEVEDLTAEATLLRSAGRLRELADQAGEALYEAEPSAFDMLGRALQAGREAARIDPAAGGLSRRIEAIQIEIREVARDVAAYAGRLEDQPGRLDRIEERLSALNALARRHGGSIESVLTTLEESRRELTDLSGAAEEAERLTGERDRLRVEALSRARDLSGRRRAAAPAMSAEVTGVLRDLSMEHATLVVEAEDAGLSETGVDAVDFMVETNPGEGAGPVASVASGGELSRITLALYSVLSASVGTPVMVYDEIDAGVSGAVAERMALVLAKAATERQVLVVTHHGHVAARASAHFLVEKRVQDGRTEAGMARLDGDARLLEIARMVGGVSITDAVLAHARELISG